MEKKEVNTEEMSRFEKETAEFFELYPDVDLDEIPKRIWDDVKKGVSLTVAYEKYAGELSARVREAQMVNEINREKAAGGVKSAQKKRYFTAKEIAEMSESEIRENYDFIIKSMESKDFY